MVPGTSENFVFTAKAPRTPRFEIAIRCQPHGGLPSAFWTGWSFLGDLGVLAVK
jgi:hypothetical protein